MLKFENPTNGRYYYVMPGKDLINDWVITIIRGGRNTRVIRHLGFDNLLSAAKEIEKIFTKRLKRGYVLV